MFYVTSAEKKVDNCLLIYMPQGLHVFADVFADVFLMLKSGGSTQKRP